MWLASTIFSVQLAGLDWLAGLLSIFRNFWREEFVNILTSNNNDDGDDDWS